MACDLNRDPGQVVPDTWCPFTTAPDDARHPCMFDCALYVRMNKPKLLYGIEGCAFALLARGVAGLWAEAHGKGGDS